MDAADKGDDVEAPPTPPPAKTGWLPKTVLALDVIGAFAGILVIITSACSGGARERESEAVRESEGE